MIHINTHLVVGTIRFSTSKVLHIYLAINHHISYFFHIGWSQSPSYLSTLERLFFYLSCLSVYLLNSPYNFLTAGCILLLLVRKWNTLMTIPMVLVKARASKMMRYEVSRVEYICTFLMVPLMCFSCAWSHIS